MSPERILRATRKSAESNESTHEERIESILGVFMQRDQEHRDFQQGIANKQTQLSSMLESVQIDVQRLVRAGEAQAAINERQIQIQSDLGNRKADFDRVERMVKELHDAMQPMAAALNKARGGLWLLMAVSGIVAALMTAVFGVTVAGINKSVEAQALNMAKLETEHENDVQDIDQRLDAMSQSLSEVRVTSQRPIEPEPKP